MPEGELTIAQPEPEEACPECGAPGIYQARGFRHNDEEDAAMCRLMR